MTAGKQQKRYPASAYMVPQEPLLFPNMTVEENILDRFHKTTVRTS